ncbi:hypothetical protein CAPTEDRAFT_186231 [Capitella teleta]|uniref:Mutator-like transposase domain-containing protein n=1 Tax=Capitella teleta TaxID=283909 RepID=R7TYH3_CAPTE|nr:hypothetical protein CAPTEDRAFT_186231 [Capitella teleta]|eukprot:ELT98677.1 hypothetical protein CAPTEDRAFT_186231 [Capitella teleta]
MQRWVRYYRTSLPHVPWTTNGVEALHHVLKTKFLKHFGDRSLHGFLSVVLKKYLPGIMMTYRAANLSIHSARVSTTPVPHYFNQRSEKLVHHCIKQLPGPAKANLQLVAAARNNRIGHAKLVSFVNQLDISGPIANEAYIELTDRLQHGALAAQEDSFQEAAAVIRQIHGTEGTQAKDVLDICISFDGAWHKRGYSSHYGVGIAIKVESGLIIDVHSIEKYRLRYKTILCDGDAKTLATLNKKQVYGPDVELIKEDCVNHVAMRMYKGIERLSTSSPMDPKDFIRALQFALKNLDIQKDLSLIIGESAQTEITILRSELKDKEVVIKKLDTRINDLENQVEGLEQYSRRNCIHLSGLPKINEKNVIERTHGVFNNTMKLDHPVSISEIDRIHRVGKKSA